MAKKKNAQPVVVELTEEKEKKKKQREFESKVALLASIINEGRNEDLEKGREKFKKALADGMELSYDITWTGYPLMVAEKLERNLIPFRTFLTGKGPNDLDMIEEHIKKELEHVVGRFLDQSWLIEWDSSTSAITNQEKKAESRALQIYGERLKRIVMYFNLRREMK